MCNFQNIQNEDVRIDPADASKPATCKHFISGPQGEGTNWLLRLQSLYFHFDSGNFQYLQRSSILMTQSNS